MSIIPLKYLLLYYLWLESNNNVVFLIVSKLIVVYYIRHVFHLKWITIFIKLTSNSWLKKILTKYKLYNMYPIDITLVKKTLKCQETYKIGVAEIIFYNLLIAKIFEP